MVGAVRGEDLLGGTDCRRPRVFIHEYRLPLPIDVHEADAHAPISKTMAAWGLRSTPSHVLLDPRGYPRLSHFGHIDDMALAAAVGQLLERPGTPGGPSSVASQLS